MVVNKNGIFNVIETAQKSLVPLRVAASYNISVVIKKFILVVKSY